MLACFSVAAIAQVRPVYELPDKDEIQRGTHELIDRVQRMNVKFEKDAAGRLTRIISEGVATDIVYDVNGKIDGYTTNGATTKARMATDIKGNPVLRIFDSTGTELQPVDLKSIGFLPSLIESMSGNKIFPTADTIDVKEFARMESQRASERLAYLLSTRTLQKSGADISCGRPGPDGDCFDGGGGGGGGGGSGGVHGLLTPRQQRLCILRCDLEKELGQNNCDRAANARQFACAAGGALLLKVPPVAGVATGACLAYSADRTADCRDGVARATYKCNAACE